MTLQPHQERVVAERDELTVKTGKLAIFIGGPVFGGLPVEERNRLFRQFTSMYEYASVLNERIAAFQDARTTPLTRTWSRRVSSTPRAAK